MGTTTLPAEVVVSVAMTGAFEFGKMLAVMGATAAVPACFATSGSTELADFQSVQPSRHTSESVPTRPSVIQRRMISPRAGPYCPPADGRTYQTASGASEIGSEEPDATLALTAGTGGSGVDAAISS